ncbi:MAG: DUF2325 domain-containing protein [Cyanobacteria bacterium P01_F01_bin.53]
MFKSLMQPLQLFLKGATGKDRHKKQQLAQQLHALQVAYDRLQCDYDQQSKAFEALQRDRNELNTLFNCADQENKELTAQNKGLRSQLKKLEEDNQTLRSELIYRHQKDEISAYQNTPDAHSQETTSNSSSALAKGGREVTEPAGMSGSQQPLEEVNLSKVSLALVGGHETTHREVSEELKKYGLKRCVHVPPHSIASNSRNQIKDKISQCDLIVTITSYVDHSVVRCVKQLRDTQMLAGEVIRVSCHGKSGVVREVLDYFAAQPAQPA